MHNHITATYHHQDRRETHPDDPLDEEATTAERTRPSHRRPKLKKRQRHPIYNNVFMLFDETKPKPENVVKLSSYPLSDKETNILFKGLSFIPFNPHTNHVSDTDITEFIRKMRLMYKYRNVPTRDNPFRQKSRQTPGPTDFIPSENLLNKTELILSQIKPTVGRLNLPENGMKLVQKLRSEQELIINQADKGSSIVLIDRQKYVDEGHKHLADLQTYTRLERDITNTIKQTIKIKPDRLYESDLISKHQYTFCCPPEKYRTSILPHKTSQKPTCL